MLKEVYVIEHGLDIFHYSASDDKTDDDFVLTSGFFSALENFSSSVRQANIDFFSSSEEIFLFSKFKQNDVSIVIVCDNDIQQSVARELLKQVKRIIHSSKLFKRKAHSRLTIKQEEKIHAKIESVIQGLISVDYQVKVAEELIETNKVNEVDQLMIYNYSKDEIHYHYHELGDFEEKEMTKTLRAIPRAVIPLVKLCNIGKNVEYITIESMNSIMVIYKNGTDLTVVISKYRNNMSDVKDIPFLLMSLPNFSKFKELYDEFNQNKQYIFDKNDLSSVKEGGFIPTEVEETIQNSFSVFDSLLESFRFDDWHEIFVYATDPVGGYLKILRNFTRGEKYFEIHTDRF